MTSQILHVFLLGLTQTFSPTPLIFAAPSPLHYLMRLSNAFFTSARDRTKRPVPGSNGSRSTAHPLIRRVAFHPFCGWLVQAMARCHSGRQGLRKRLPVRSTRSKRRVITAH